MDEPATTWPAAPVEGAITVQVEYAPDEFGRMAAGVWLRNWRLWLVVLVMLTALTGLMNWDELEAGEWWLWFIAPLATLLIGASVLWGSYSSGKRQQRDTATTSKPLTFIFGPDRVWITGHGFREEVEYQVFFGAEETRDHILLMFNSTHRYIIPKRAIPNPQALATLRQSINQGLPGKAKLRLKN